MIDSGTAITSSPRRVLITGAAGALGQVVVTKFADAGDQVVAIHHSIRSAESRMNVVWHAVDVTRAEEVASLFERAGPFDVVVHCAGGFRYGRIEDVSNEDFQYLRALNFESSFFIARSASFGMRKQKSGVLLFISSMATVDSASGFSAYAATKAAVNALVKSLAVEWKGDGVRVNAILPSIIDTAANRQAMPEADPSKWVSPHAIANRLYELTLPESETVTGALIPMPGGN